MALTKEEKNRLREAWINHHPLHIQCLSIQKTDEQRLAGAHNHRTMDVGDFLSKATPFIASIVGSDLDLARVDRQLAEEFDAACAAGGL
jgi:hypothetical protein